MIRTGLHVLALGALILAASCAYSQNTPSADPAHRARLEALDTAWNDGLAGWREEQSVAIQKAMADMEAARKEGRPPPPFPAMQMAPPKDLVEKHLADYQNAATDYAGSDAAIPFLLWILRNAPLTGDKDTVDATAETLTTAHLKSRELGEVPIAISTCSRLIGEDRAAELLRRIEAGSPDGDISARATLARVGGALRNAPTSSEIYANAKLEALRAAAAASDEAIQIEVTGIIDGREKLVIGEVAPDIAGIDLDGVAFKLSDYKGKVVMLDFWGDW